MPEITTVTLNQLNALTRGSESAAVRNNTSGQTLANSSASVVVSQVLANTITLTNPQNKQSVQLPASALSNLGNIKTGQSFELVNVPNKANIYALIPAATAARQNALPGQTSQVLASTNLNINDNQLNAVVSKASLSGDLSFNGKPTVTITGRITAISANQVSLSFTVPGSNLPAQQAQITLSKSQVSALSVNSSVNISVDVSGKQARIISLSSSGVQSAGLQGVSPQAPNNQGLASQNSTLTLSSQLAQLNNNALPSKLLSSAILQQLAGNGQLAGSTGGNQAGSQATALALAQTTNNLGKLSQVVIPLNDAKLAELPKSLLTSLQAAIAKVNTTGATQVSLVIENAGNANTLKLSVLGNLNKSAIELNKSQVRALVSNVDNKLTSNSGANANVNNAGKGQSANVQIGAGANIGATSTRAATASIAGALSEEIAKQGFIGSRADLVANKTLSQTATLAGNAASNSGNIASKGLISGLNAEATSVANATVNSGVNIAQKANAIVNTGLNASVNSPSSNGSNNANTSLNQATENTTSKQAALSALNEQQNTQTFKTNTLLEQLTKFVNSTSQTSSSGITGANIDALKNQVQALIKGSAGQSATQTQTLSNIINALNANAEIDALSPETQTLLKSVKELIPAATAQPAPIDARAIQQLLGAPINNAPINAMSPTAASGFLSGLVILLQVGLATKLQRQSNKMASKLQDQIPEVLKSIVPNISSTQSAKLMQDFRQFDTKHTLSAEVAKMLFSHQQHKLKGIESSLQGQDQLYYALPNMFSKDADDIELLVKRETREQKNSAGESKTSSWYLTMKLDVGPMGQMLAKTQLTEDEVKLQLYTSTTELKNKALDMLPYLQRRLSAFGITMTEKSCQLGKIPQQLKSEHYQVFETQV